MLCGDLPVADRKVDLLSLACLQDPEERAAVVKLLAAGEAQTVAAAQKLLKAEASAAVVEPEPAYDREGHPITDPQIAEAFALFEAPKKEVIRQLRAARRTWKRFIEEQKEAQLPSMVRAMHAYDYWSMSHFLEWDLRRLTGVLGVVGPYALCPSCGGAPWSEAKDQRCEGCRGAGWVGRSSYQSAPPEMKEALDARGVHRSPEGEEPSDAAECAVETEDRPKPQWNRDGDNPLP